MATQPSLQIHHPVQNQNKPLPAAPQSYRTRPRTRFLGHLHSEGLSNASLVHTILFFARGKKRESTSRTRVYSDRRIPTHRTVLSQGSAGAGPLPCAGPPLLCQKNIISVSEMEKATPSTLPGCCAKKEAKRKLVVASSSFAEKFRTSNAPGVKG